MALHVQVSSLVDGPNGSSKTGRLPDTLSLSFIVILFFFFFFFFFLVFLIVVCSRIIL
jgi:hypothetical protein